MKACASQLLHWHVCLVLHMHMIPSAILLALGMALLHPAVTLTASDRYSILYKAPICLYPASCIVAYAKCKTVGCMDLYQAINLNNHK